MLLGELLIKKNLITQAQLDLALAQQAYSKDFLGFILVKQKLIREEDLLQVLSEQFHLPSRKLTSTMVDWKLAMSFSPSLVMEHQCLPIQQDDSGITVVMVNPLDASALSLIEEQTKGVHIKVVLVSMSDMSEAIKNYSQQRSARIKHLLE